MNTNQPIQPYLNLFERALLDKGLADRFKSTNIFASVVGFTELVYAMQAYQHVKKNETIFANLDLFMKNDTIGRPILAPVYHNGKQAGCDTMRFVETACHLFETFGDITGPVYEFGCCYGGLAYVLTTQFKGIKDYYLKDFAVIERFAVSYLKKLNDFNYKISSEAKEVADLFISEYALTEMPLDQMYEAYNKYAKPANKVFIRANLPKAEDQKKLVDTIKQDFQGFYKEIREPDYRSPNLIVMARK